MTPTSGSRLIRLFALVCVTTALPLVALLWLGVRVLDQDRQLERQHLQDRLERSADVVVAAIQRQIESSEQALSTETSDWPQGLVTLTMTVGNTPIVSPRERVAFLPVVASKARPDDGLFAKAEALQLQQHDLAGAIAGYEATARSVDRPTQTGALLRLARAREAVGDTAAALSIYQRLSAIDDVFIADTPASLVAAYARCRLFETHGNHIELATEARRMRTDLEANRWPLTAPVYWLYRDDALKWTNESTPQTSQAELLAIGITALWDRWHDVPVSAVPAKGHDSISVGNDSLTAMWTKTGSTLHALLATPQYVHDHWLDSARQSAAQAGVAFSVGDATTPDVSTTLRTTAQTDLPWPIVVSSLEPTTEGAAFASRRRLLVAGFVLLLAMGFVAGTATIRAVSREFAVARLQSDFVSTVSHELRSPLTALRQFTDRLRDNANLDAADRAICYDAQSRATERLTRLVESLLDFGRMEAGSRPYALEPVDCADIVGLVLSDFERSQHRPAAAIRLHRNGPAPVLADREALSLAVWNLVDNAVKYSSAPATIDVDVVHSAGHVDVAVRDHGIGIPREEQAFIFQKFQRGQAARDRGFNGTGLGLAIVDHIVRAHHGQISVKSAVGEGSTFTITLPTS